MTSRSTDTNAFGALGLLSGVIIFWYALNRFKRDPKKWYGKMFCAKCGHQWRSRPEVAPDLCPQCTSNRVEQKLG